MYYDDEARRFNFASGLLLGAVLGAGLALLALPRRPIRNPRRIRRSGRALKEAAEERLGRVPDPISNLRSALKRAAR